MTAGEQHTAAADCHRTHFSYILAIDIEDQHTFINLSEQLLHSVGMNAI